MYRFVTLEWWFVRTAGGHTSTITDQEVHMYVMTLEWVAYDPYESMEACQAAYAAEYGVTAGTVRDVHRFWEVVFTSDDRAALVRLATSEAGGLTPAEVEEFKLIEKVT